MVQLGFTRSVGLTPGTEPEHAENWRRPEGAVVDLHWTLVGAHANPSRVWEVIRSRTQARRIVDLEVMVPSAALRPLLVALHAGQHGREFGRTLDDLERALEIASDEDWRVAAVLAREMDAVEAFAAGLRLSPAGSRVAETLALPKQTSVATELRSATPVPTSTGYEWLAKTPGFFSRIRLLWFKLIPPAAFMRDWHPLARRGRIGLVLAYLYRPLWLAWWAPRGYLAWRRAKRASERSRTAVVDGTPVTQPAFPARRTRRRRRTQLWGRSVSSSATPSSRTHACAITAPASFPTPSARPGAAPASPSCR